MTLCMNENACVHAPLSARDCLFPDWHVASRVRALFTTRTGGVSEPPYGQWHHGTGRAGGLNLGFCTGDKPQHVAENRARLAAFTGVPAAWLALAHGADVIRAEKAYQALNENKMLRADASVSAQSNLACVVTTADCLPVLICDQAGRAVGAAHAGWRGLAAGVLEHTAAALAALAGASSELHAFLGPAIGPRAFEVGAEVRAIFLARATRAEASATEAAFCPHGGAAGKYWADIFALARLRLARAGISYVGGGAWCTVSDPARFYSYRRDRLTGRLAAMIWLAG